MRLPGSAISNGRLVVGSVRVWRIVSRSGCPLPPGQAHHHHHRHNQHHRHHRHHHRMRTPTALRASAEEEILGALDAPGLEVDASEALELQPGGSAIAGALDRLSDTVSTIADAASPVIGAVSDTVSTIASPVIGVVSDTVTTIAAAAPPAYSVKSFSAQEVLYIPAFLLLLRPTLRAGYFLSNKTKSVGRSRDGTADERRASDETFEDSVFGFMERPLQLLVIPITIDFVLDNAVNYIADLPASTAATMETLDTAGRRIESLAYMIWSTGIASQLKTKYLDSLLENYPAGRNLQPSISKALDVALVFYFSATTLQVFGLNAQALGLAGVTSLLIALPAQTLLQQFLASLILSAPGRNFAKGDYVSIGDARGTVSDVGWYRTELITDDSHPIYVPNDMCIKNTNYNYSRGAHRHWVEQFSIIGGDLEAFHSVVDAMREEFRASGVCDPTMPMRVHMDGFEDCGVCVRVEVYIRKEGDDEFQLYMDRKHTLMGITLRILSAYGCRLASQASARLLTAEQATPPSNWKPK